jgi:hypothetical protein
MKILKTAFTTVLLGLLAAAPAYSQTEQDAEAGMNAALGIIGSSLTDADLNATQVEAALSAYLGTLAPAQRADGAVSALRVLARLVPDFFGAGLRTVRNFGITLDRTLVESVVTDLPEETKTVVEAAVREVAPDALPPDTTDATPPPEETTGTEDSPEDEETPQPEIGGDEPTPPVENDADLTEGISPT